MGFVKALLYSEIVLWGVMALAVLVQRKQLLPFTVTFGGFGLALLLSALVAVVSLVVLILSFSVVSPDFRPYTLAATILGVGPLVMIMWTVGAGFGVPRIHDITTDLDHNVAFENAQKLRSASDNSLALPSEKEASLHRDYYATLDPLIVDQPPKQAYEKSLQVAQSLGWEVVFQRPEQGHFEAIDRTAIFGFVDDIAVRVTPLDRGSRIDLRSVSRVGLSDLGANAKRIRAFKQGYRKKN